MNVLPEERIRFSHLWIVATHLNSLFGRFASRLEQNDVAGCPSKNQFRHVTMVMRQHGEARVCLCPNCIECVASNDSHTRCKTACLHCSARLHEATPRLCKCSRSLLEKERLFFGEGVITPLDWREKCSRRVTQCFLSLFFSPSPSVLSIFNVYRFYLAWHRQQPLWQCTVGRFLSV